MPNPEPPCRPALRRTPRSALSNVGSLLLVLVALAGPGVAGVAIAEDEVAAASPRRLTRLEYAHTLEELLKLHPDAAAHVATALPPEADSIDFDTLAANQGLSGLHIRAYVAAAAAALDAAIELGPQPSAGPTVIDYTTGYPTFIATGTFFGGGVVKIVDDGAVLIADYTCTYTLDTSYGFPVARPGRYRATLEAYRWQGISTVVFNLFRGKQQGIAASLDELIGVWDLTDDAPRTVTVDTYLRPGDLLAPCVAELDGNGGNPFTYVEENVLLQDSDYPGEGVVFKHLTIEGPLYDQWPPSSTRAVLDGVDFTAAGEIQLTRSQDEHLYEVVASFAERAFRRPVRQDEVDALVALGQDVLDEGRTFLEAVRVPLTAILASPEFVFQPQEYDPGLIDDYEFATRLAYFVWRGPPDEELSKLAEQGALADPRVVGEQIDRMVADPRSWRFVEDFAAQAWRLDEIRFTTPAVQFPYDERLGQAMEMETRLFLAELVRQDLSVRNLIDSDFTFVNRRLAKLYRIPNVFGQEMRRIDLPADSVRGGLLTQGAILKITANGTNTSPVPRGNFVLGPLLGTPMPPPPPGVTGLEPDTRGTTTIREQLDAHRTEPVCNSCHQVIDPPGFALEEFDPIGGYRVNYRRGVRVDATGVTPSGKTFDGIVDYKQILLDEQVDQVARNLVGQLVALGTGRSVGVEDRDAVNQILNDTRGAGFGFRSIMAAVAQSPIFQRR